MAGQIRRKNRALILQAAEQVFAEKGLEGATTRAIANLAGLPKSNILYYFGTKEQLYRSLLEQNVRLWLDAFGRFGVDDDPIDALESYVVEKVRMSFARPHASRIFAREMLSGGGHLRLYLESELRDWVQERALVMRGWIAKGLMSPVDPHHLLFTIWAATQTFADFAPQVEAVEGGPPDAAGQAAIARSVAEFVLRACIPASRLEARRTVRAA
ncbi:TetR family transcriptional regulator C-terminal domain-containing protein [Geminicoccus roseus]|uniref:TetR family transcriptional regulator C-terminal domain-containing protein n=1 Tax=Geminicoccus roseus TaxID=404900 RepID=UPI000427FD9E|nr:TetR family transcriptional regulator C-terminal domain-containing protein [Geminicoccus roseus]